MGMHSDSWFMDQYNTQRQTFVQILKELKMN